MTFRPCMSYCKHGGVCILERDHKENHNSNYCDWGDKEGLTKTQADKIMIEKNGEFGRLIADTERNILEAMGEKIE